MFRRGCALTSFVARHKYQPAMLSMCLSTVSHSIVENVGGHGFGVNLSRQSRISTKNLPLESRRKQLLYRCRQRGLLELDLVLGEWAFQNVFGMNASELDLFEEIVDVENPDLLKFLVDKTIPEGENKHLTHNKYLAKLIDFAHLNKAQMSRLNQSRQIHSQNGNQ